MKFTSLLIIVIISFQISAQDYVNRSFFNAKMEPIHSVLHGAGQDSDGFYNYYNLMDSNHKPIVYMYYNHISNIGTHWAKDLKKELLNYGDNVIVIQFGLQLVGSLESIVSGDLDDDINDLLDGCAELGMPIYMRIGYEFNGYAWNKYDPIPYKLAFNYITQKIRQSDLEIATVWNYAPDGNSNYMDFYPGDESVDWWSINIFQASQITNSTSVSFMNDAESHNKPVIIGESTPRYTGVLDGQADWDAWFEPFFNFLKTEPSIKMTGYINWNWAEWASWSDWGDARIQANKLVADNFRQELIDTIYIHSTSEKEFRTQLGYTEDVRPTTVKNIVINDSEYPATISWSPSEDDSKIAKYILLTDDKVIDQTSKTNISLLDYEPYKSFELSLVALDRAGNFSLPSELFYVTIPPSPDDPENIVLNGDFEFGIEPWIFDATASDVIAEIEIDSTYQINKKFSAKVQIENSNNVLTSIELKQTVNLVAGRTYILEYSAKANQNTSLESWFYVAKSPDTVLTAKSALLTTEIQSFKDSLIIEKDTEAILSFMLGSSGNTEIFIDKIILLEEILPIGNDKIINGRFNDKLYGWTLNHYVGDVDGIFSIDTTAKIEGDNSAHIIVNKVTGTNWHLQFQQLIQVKKDHRYTLSYKARSAEPAIIETWLQQNHPNYFGYINNPIQLDTTIKEFSHITEFIPEDDEVYVTFMLGATNTTEFWFDDIKLIEESLISEVKNTEEIVENFNKFELINAYPNPFNNLSTISFSIPNSGLVNLTVYNLLGEKVRQLVDDKFIKGIHNIKFDANNLSSGVYIYQIQYKDLVRSKKIILLK